MKILAKIFLTLLITAAALFGGFIAKFIANVAGGGFYAVIAWICSAILWLFAVAKIWGLYNRKLRFLLNAAFGLALLSVAVFEINRAYVRSIDEVGEWDTVDLTFYEPFRENTKAVALNEQSSLKITEDLPKLDGATALYPLYSAFARAVYPESYYMNDIHKNNYDYVVCANTVGAYERLINGETDIIFVAEPSQEQLQMAKDKGVELKLTPIGREAFVFFVSAKNSVSDLSVDDIQKIYSGETENWKEIGGKNVKIKAFQRPINSGSQTALIKIKRDITVMNQPSKDVVNPMGGIITKVSSYKNYNSAIGYSFLFFATEMVNDNKIKLLSVNGIAPTRENVTNGTYPYASEFYAVTAGTQNPNAQKLIDWILSEQGQYLVEKTGYTPLVTTGKAEYEKITPEQAAEMMLTKGGEVVILDVRSQEEFDAGHIKNAVLLPDYEVKDRAEIMLTDKTRTILVYCRTGRRSESAAKELIAMGYTSVYDFGGIMDWIGEIIK